MSDEDWNADPPFPAEHTHTYDFDIDSSTGVDNFVLHMTMHETVNANGVPTATVDNYRAECRGSPRAWRRWLPGKACRNEPGEPLPSHA